jgi:DNA transformation protein
MVRDIGPKSKQWLASIDVHTLDDVVSLGVIETYKRVKAAYPENVSLNLLYALQAALLDLPWNELPPDIKDELKQQVKSQ